MMVFFCVVGFVICMMIALHPSPVVGDDVISDVCKPILAFIVAMLCLYAVFQFGLPVNRQEYATFQQQKAYLASHIADSEIEDAALTAKKVELNDWLFRNQYRIGKHPRWYIGIPEGFLEETPIE